MRAADDRPTSSSTAASSVLESRLAVAEADLVRVVQVVVALDQERASPACSSSTFSNAPGVVVEVRRQERAEPVRSDASTRVTLPPTGSPPWLARNVVSGRLSFCVLVVAEREQLVLDDRTAEPSRRCPVVVNVPGLTASPAASVPTNDLVAEAVIDRADQLVGAAARHRVDAGADEVALAHVVGRDADLHLLDRFERDRRDAGAVAGLAAAGRTSC